MLASVSQASLTPYPGEDGLVLAPVGEDPTDTPTLAGMELPPPIVVGVVDLAGAGLPATSISSDRTLS